MLLKQTVRRDSSDGGSKKHVGVDDVKKMKCKEVAVVEGTKQRTR